MVGKNKYSAVRATKRCIPAKMIMKTRKLNGIESSCITFEIQVPGNKTMEADMIVSATVTKTKGPKKDADKYYQSVSKSRKANTGRMCTIQCCMNQKLTISCHGFPIGRSGTEDNSHDKVMKD